MNIRNILPHMHYYWLVAKNKSFSKAAEESHVSPSAVSYQIKALEDKLNIVLLSRESGQLPELTPQGKKIANECYRIFNYLNDFLDEIQHEESSLRLNFTAPSSHGANVLSPALSMFKKQMPLLNYTLNLTNNILNLDMSKTDIAIRSLPHTADICGERLMYVRLKMLASQEYLNNNPPINSLKDLQQHTIVSFEHEMHDWYRLKNAYPDMSLPTMNQVVVINNNTGICNAVREGLGIGLIPDYAAITQADDNVTELFPEIFNDQATELYDTLYICYPRLSHKEKVVRSVIKLYKEYLQSINQLVIFDD